MSLDVEKNREHILRAFNDVVSDKKTTDWALFGYEGQTNVLKLVGTGEDGLEELADDLNSSKIMYAVVKVIDPNTTRPKIVLINWQGEGAPTVRKGTCARHLHDVHKLLRGIHVTVNARTEEEVEPEVVMEAVLKASATTYNFKERSEINDKTTPVRVADLGVSADPVYPDAFTTNPVKPKPNPKTNLGTNYKRTNPLAEIDSKSRNKFWEQQEEEEKRRKIEEQRQKEEELKKLEIERKQREITETKQRDNLTRERNARIVAERRAEDEAAQRVAVKQDGKKWEEELASHHREEEERARRAEVMRLERKKEAESLIGKRTHAFRDRFEAGVQQNPEPLMSAGDKNRPPPRRLKEFHPINEQREESREVNTRGGVPGRGVAARWPLVNTEPSHNNTHHYTPPTDFRGTSNARTPIQDIIPAPSSPPTAPSKQQQQQPVNTTPTHADESSTGHVRNLLRAGLPTRQDSDDEDKADKDEWHADPQSTSANISTSHGMSLPTNDTLFTQSSSQIIHANNQSNISQTYSVNNETQLTQNQSSPTVTQPSPTLDQIDPTFSQSMPTFNDPSPHIQSAPSYTHPTSTYHQPSQSYSEHAITPNQPVPTYNNQMDPPTKQTNNSSLYMQENPAPQKVTATYTNGGSHIYEQPTEEKLNINGGRQSSINGTHHSKTTINNDESSVLTVQDTNAKGATTVNLDNAHSTPAIGMLYEVDGVEYQILPEHGLCARALYDYQAADDTEITFDPSEIITNIDQIDEGWWQGVGPDGMYGLFPANYVELINQATS